MVITGTRADYGLLKNTIKEIHLRKDLELQLVVTGSHVSTIFGSTIKEINNDGFPISAIVAILDHEESNLSIINATSKAVAGIGAVIHQKNPDIVLVLGDRYEALASALAATILNKPIAHIHGGELTFGALDDAFRHSITKMSWFHFTTAEEYKQRVIKLGESPDRVFNIGSPAIDSLVEANISKIELEDYLGKELVFPVLLVTFHPETMSPGLAENHIKTVFAGILASKPGTVVFTKANADAEGAKINNSLEELIKTTGNDRFILVSSLGHKRYLSLLSIADVAIGNSSSLVIEAPMLKVPSVVIGKRQDGRVRCSSVIDVPFSVQGISEAILKAISIKFKQKVQETTHPFGNPGVAKKIVDILATCSLPNNLMKGFYE
jgi:GDP/UDP-N,N'-diacetylbacillosamine 2-epimerase (hydrolysing)